VHGKDTSVKTWQHILLGTLLGLLFSAVIYLTAVPPKGKPFLLQAAPTPSPYVIFVSGAVKHPGVYSLPPSSRIADAIEAAGGMLETADTSQINLALQIRDSDKINVPYQGEESAVPPADNSGELLNSIPSLPININSASQIVLETLPGIGATRARDIILYRETNGEFETIEDLQKVTGIGPVTYERLRSLITVD
jgi:competence protein ComEA